MRKLEFTVHEFMTIMGTLDEAYDGAKPPEDSVLVAWREQYDMLDKRLESLPMMERADMLFDGKMTINAISDGQLNEVLGVVRDHIKMHEKLIAENDLDADPEELETWQDKLGELEAIAAGGAAEF